MFFWNLKKTKNTYSRTLGVTDAKAISIRVNVAILAKACTWPAPEKACADKMVGCSTCQLLERLRNLCIARKQGRKSVLDTCVD